MLEQLVSTIPPPPVRPGTLKVQGLMHRHPRFDCRVVPLTEVCSTTPSSCDTLAELDVHGQASGRVDGLFTTAA
jgi:hypothetical protein